MTRVTAGFRAGALGWGIADRLGVTFYTTQNERPSPRTSRFLSPALPSPPGSGISIDSRNLTDIGTYGTRLELARGFGRGHVITYGVDWYLDDSENADTTPRSRGCSVRRRRAPVRRPPCPTRRCGAAAPMRRRASADPDRLDLGLGVRGQTIQSETSETPGLGQTARGFPPAMGPSWAALSLGYQIARALT